MTAYSLTGGYGTPQTLSDGSIKENPTYQMLNLILIELRTMNEILMLGLNVEDETASWRTDASLTAPSTLTNPS